jgi:hypothetical protein
MHYVTSIQRMEIKQGEKKSVETIVLNIPVETISDVS